MQLVHPPLTVVAATISTLLAGSVLAAAPTSQDAALADETRAFLQWLADDHFTLLGYRRHDLAHEQGEDLLRSLRGAAVFDGFRGAPPVDMAALSAAVSTLSHLVTEQRST